MVTTRRNDSRHDANSGVPRVILIGVDHRCAPLELREKVSYSRDEGRELLHRLEAADEIAEACLVSTCNRTEVYLLPRQESAAYRLGFEEAFLQRAPEIEAEGRFYVKRGNEAIRHLFEVASGLQSMVLGEPEILGQVKKAAQDAEELGISGTVLGRLLRAGVSAGGRVRHETAIGAGAISFGYAVVDLARNIFSSLETCSVLIVGAGETGRQVTRNLIERGVVQLTVTNRSAGRVEEFRQLFPQAVSIPFEERAGAFACCDLIVASTGAEEPVVTRRDLERAMDHRKTRPLLVADLGVPRNVEPAAGRLESVFLQDIDSLEQLIAKNLKRRREEIPKVQEILEQELDHFSTWHRSLAAEPLVAQLQKHAEQIRRSEVASILRRFPADTHDQLEVLTRSLVRKLLHNPSHHLRSGDRSDVHRFETTRRLFGLDEDTE
ncbi:MAG: glutamyl-tRNA reductase [Acidobacteriota bacterium]